MAKVAEDVNVKGLRELYKTDSEAKAMFDHLASRERDRRETTVDRLRWNLNQGGGDPISRGQIVRLFRQLEELGCGNFIPGRWGHESRFRWSVGLADVGRAASGQSVRMEPPSTAELDAPNDLLDHRFHLRKDLDVALKLPSDLTSTEAARLAAFIQTLPFSTNSIPGNSGAELRA
jgi:hypothetical protein